MSVNELASEFLNKHNVNLTIFNITLFVTELIVIVKNYKIRGLKKKQLVLDTLELIIQKSNISQNKKAKLLEYNRDIAPCIIDVIIAVNNKKINVSNKPKLFCI
jgi:hypothetical protein